MLCSKGHLNPSQLDLVTIWIYLDRGQSEHSLNGSCKAKSFGKLLCCISQANNREASCQLQGLGDGRFTDWGISLWVWCSQAPWKVFSIVFQSVIFYEASLTDTEISVQTVHIHSPHTLRNVTWGWSVLGHHKCVRLEVLSTVHVLKCRDQRFTRVLSPLEQFAGA